MNTLSALMSDVILGDVTANVCNAAVRAASQMIATANLQLKYGSMQQDGTKRLVFGDAHAIDAQPDSSNGKGQSK